MNALSGIPTDYAPTDYTEVTEAAGQPASSEQVERTAHRYVWAQKYCAGKDVVEVACGAGLGLELLGRDAQSLSAGDISETLLERTRALDLGKVDVDCFDACNMPYKDNSKDVIVLFEAIYYLADQPAFFTECRRVLRPGGVILFANANKDLYDFNPSAWSTSYPGVVELNELSANAGFNARFWGYMDTTEVSSRQRILRPVKWLAANLGLIPKSMKAKALFKKLFFGSMTTMPASISEEHVNYHPPVPIPADRPDSCYKVIYCEARLDPTKAQTEQSGDH
ncbi:MAG: class I SAM-dependent methyltransferase [Pseudomonadota bacterium]